MVRRTEEAGRSLKPLARCRLGLRFTSELLMHNEQDPQHQTIHTGVQAVSATTARSRAIVIAGMVILLVLPFAYLALHGSHFDTVGASEQQPSAASTASVATLEAAARSNPTSANQINLSQAYINNNAPGRAVPVLQGLLASDPNNLIAWNNLCVAHTLLQEYIPAMDACNHALQIDPGYQLARNNLKWAQNERQKAVEALAAQEHRRPPIATPASIWPKGSANSISEIMTRPSRPGRLRYSVIQTMPWPPTTLAPPT